MKIGIYGGTFNPIHQGHTQAARFAAEYLGLDRLILIPAGIPPHKALAENGAESRHRLAMTELAAGSMDCSCPVSVSDMELTREGRSYTVDTLRQLREAYPEAQLYFLMGTDMFLTFHLWRQPEEIVKLCTLCAFGRTEADTEELFAVQRQFLREKFGADTVTVTLPKITDISSTRLREQLAAGKGAEFLSPAVYGYILLHGLYGVHRDLKKLSGEELRCAALAMLQPNRVAHVLGTEETAVRLALRYGAAVEDARQAALFHDCTKKLDREHHLALLRQYGGKADEEELREDALLHAPTGAAVAEQVFGVSAEVASAIRWHTTGRANMTLLEKIIWLSDYIEPTRRFCDLTELRALAFIDLDRAVLQAMTMSVDHLEKKGMPVHPNSVFARDHLKGILHEQG